MDIVLEINNIPKIGETILSKNFTYVPGGKGANQAVAAKRLGANVYMIGKLGNDGNGKILYKALEKDVINLEHISYDYDNPTGMAIIMVNNEGNNSIIVVSGSNMNISSKEIEKATDIIKNSRVIIAQLETPIEATMEAFKIAKDNNIMTILNPAPARKIPEELLKLTDIIIPNETEIFELTNIKVVDEESAKKAAQLLLDKGVRYVIITIGDKGAVIVSKGKCEIVPAYKVIAIDTTAAGDSFIGALASSLEFDNNNEYNSIKQAIEFANKVSAIVVQRKGAQPSLPYLEEVMKTYK